MYTCTSKDCPNGTDEQIRELCEVFYPYGKRKM